MKYLNNFKYFQRITILKIFRFFIIYGVNKTLFKVAGRSRGKLKFLTIFLRRKKKNPDIGVIGCGQFTYSTLGHVILSNYGNRFLDCYDIDTQAADTFADFYKINHHSLDSKSIFDNKDVKYVYIASNHASHADYAIEALSKDKIVYLEKPIVVNRQQLSRLIRCANSAKKPIYAGYNRPFSKAILDLKTQVLSNFDMPITLNCFVSAHKLPPHHWYRDKNEGTRICGNVGHWIDLGVHILSWTKLPDKWDIQVAFSNPLETDDDISISLTSSRGDLIVIVITSRAEPFEGINETINFQQGEVIC
ncbi:Gfo/Idh/MocA family oxidoreductase, partial [Candidatus Thioglobus sp.]|nr:Gfo/Idh/MocA family oxidoreductase [Candidatus Thioglobus sp.]